MKRLPVLALAGLLLSGCAAARQDGHGPGATATTENRSPERSARAADIVADAARTLKELRKATAHRILDYALEDAVAVIVLPGVYHAGFFYSVNGGSGIIVVRAGDGSWGSPAFVGVGGVGFGLQAGLEKQRLVLVVQDREMLESILKGGLSFDAMAKYDVLNVREEVSRGSLTTGQPVLAFSDGAGIMAGVGLRGALLTLNEGLTHSYYPDRTDAKGVLAGKNAPGIEVFELWGALSGNLP